MGALEASFGKFWHYLSRLNWDKSTQLLKIVQKFTKTLYSPQIGKSSHDPSPYGDGHPSSDLTPSAPSTPKSWLHHCA